MNYKKVRNKWNKRITDDIMLDNPPELDIMLDDFVQSHRFSNLSFEEQSRYVDSSDEYCKCESKWEDAFKCKDTFKMMVNHEEGYEHQKIMSNIMKINADDYERSRIDFSLGKEDPYGFV